MPAPRAIRCLALAAAGVALAAPQAASAAATVHLRGTAYEFNNVKVRLGGATIRVVEFPQLHATAAANGSYDLAVPDRSKVTPYIVAAGHHTIHLQTFTTAGEDLANVNFQTPTTAIYQALAGLLAVPLDAAGELRDCAIVSTFSTVNVRALGFDAFTAYGAHGVAGATAALSPAAAAPIYFNAGVIPDRGQQRSSRDGGVIWTGVPAGVYTVRASHPTARFASFVATCVPGRIVNANPPWGLHQLAAPSPARFTASWRRSGAAATLRSLRVTRVPSKAVVGITCSGRRCPFTTRSIGAAGPVVDVRRILGDARSRLRAGQTLEVRVSAPAHDTAVARWAITAKGKPRLQRRCVPLGLTLPRAC